MELVKMKEDEVIPADDKRTIAGMIVKYAECRFCGQVHMLQYNEEPENDARVNEDAVMVCDCQDAMDWQWMQKAAGESKHNLEILNDEMKMNFPERTLNFCNEAIDLIAAGEIESQVITSGTRRISIKKKGTIGIVIHVKKTAEAQLEA